MSISSAGAQYIDLGTQCTPGSFRACVSVEVSVIYHAPGVYSSQPTTELVFRMANPQGTKGFPGAPSGFKSMRIQDLEYVYGGGDSQGITWFRLAEGNAASGRSTDIPNLNYLDNGLADVWWSINGPSAFYGCDVPPGMPGTGWWEWTCGWFLTYSVFSWDHLRFTKNTSFTLEWETYPHGTTWEDGYSRVNCTVNVDCVTVTPEPATLALMATGLAGIAGARARRRRKIVIGNSTPTSRRT